MLDTVVYPSNISRSERQEAINATKAFLAEMEDLIDCGVTYVSGALHLRINLRTNASAHLLLEIARSAHRHGLVYYDPQSDSLNLPSSETRNLVESNEQEMNPDEQAITTIYGGWTVRAYSEATRRCYERIEESGSDLCGCANCKNFVLVRDRAYPPEVLIVLDSLGVDFRKESEVHYYGRTTAGLHTYRGWFYVVGSIEDGPESWRTPSKSKSQRRYDRIGHSFQVEVNKKSDYGFSDWETVLISAGFGDGPCIEIDFYTDLPWLSDAPEPGL
jgi:hypothetical protein